MTTVSVTSSAIPTEKGLRRLLLLRKPEDTATLLALLENPPPDAPEAVISLLAHIAKDARSNSAHIKGILQKTAMSVSIQVALCLMFVVQGQGVPEMIRLLAWTQPLGALISDLIGFPQRAWVARHAVLLLARVNDERAVLRLANLWITHPLTAKEAAFNVDAGRELARLLVNRGGKRFESPNGKSVRALVEKALPTGRMAKIVSRLRQPRDLPETDMDLLLTVVRHLSQPYARRDPHTAEPNADTATLETIAALGATGTNYNLLRDTTQVLLKQRGERSVMTERRLVRCLSEAERGDDTALCQWVNTMPDEEVTRRLRSIATRSSTWHSGFWLSPLLILFHLRAAWWCIQQGKPAIQTFSTAFMTCLFLWYFFTELSKWRVRKGCGAVLFLAKRGDGEMLPVLARSYLRGVKGGSDWASKVESSLINLLDRLLGNSLLTAEQPELYKLVQMIAEKRPLHKAHRDFSNGKADVTAAAIRLLSYIGGVKNRGLLIAISRQPAPDSVRFPNRRLVYDCAVQCLAKPVGLLVVRAATAASSQMPNRSHSPAIAATVGTGINTHETMPLLLTQKGSESA